MWHKWCAVTFLLDMTTQLYIPKHVVSALLTSFLMHYKEHRPPLISITHPFA